MTTHPPTDEQQAVLDMTGDHAMIAVEALAGTGKTSTLEMLARQEHQRGRSVLYLAFNKAIAVEAGERMGKAATAKTFHGQAFGAVARPLARKLKSPRMGPMQLAALLGVDAVTVRVGQEIRTLRAGYVAGVVMRTIDRWCASGDTEPNRYHVPWVDAFGEFDREIHGQYAGAVLDAVPAAWRDIEDPAGRLPFKHDHYLKMWQLSGPRIPFDVILFDEAQDASPVMNAIVAAQSHAQVVYVGDSRQEIYGWRGAENAMANIDADSRAWLTRSFRFGPEIAEQANLMLVKLGSEKLLTGAGKSGRVERCYDPTVTLCRTNAKVVDQAFECFDEGRTPFVVGGIDDVTRFARAARDLMGGRSTDHPDLAPFTTWAEVRAYTEEDMLGAELARMVRTIDEHGADAVIALGERLRRGREDRADVILSTAHKSKGRQWPKVQLADDYPGPSEKRPVVAPEELRLLYVAATRAQQVLDPFDAWPWATPAPVAATAANLNT